MSLDLKARYFLDSRSFRQENDFRKPKHDIDLMKSFTRSKQFEIKTEEDFDRASSQEDIQEIENLNVNSN